MAVSDYLALIVMAIAAWSQYRCYFLQEELSRCSEKEELGNKVVSQSEIQEHLDDGEEDPQIVDRRLLAGGSSVWCSGSNNTDRMCQFHNLCFSQKHKEFVFLSGSKSIAFGLPENPFDPALVDLSSVPNHNTQYFGFSHLPVAALEDTNTVAVFRGKHLLMNRFNPSNIMHVFHDDLLPLFYTMLQSGLMAKGDFKPTARLVFLDGYPAGEFMDLYASLFNYRPILRDEITSDSDSADQDSLVCFEEAFVGLSNVTTWYQYGFQVPQGPVPNTLLTAREVRVFTSFVRNQMGARRCEASDDYIVLIKRESTRLILNEMDLVTLVAQGTGLRVLTAGLEDYPIKDLIELVSCSKVLIGMHGSLLILSMFLPVGSMLLELFPYAINPDYYTPYKTLVQLPGMGVAYRSWRNWSPDRSVGHPDALPAHGGIRHLSRQEQKQILTSQEVPQHLCCSNPDWLYRIYQDTAVDIPSILNLLSEGLQECQQSRTEIAPHFPVFPSKVGGIHCDRVKGLRVSWQRPWNIEYMNTNEVRYELWTQETDGDDYKAYILQLEGYTFSEGYEDSKSYRVWVRCLVGSIKGPFSSVVC
ncbi:protein O-linked-mannose beta-1,4-N-acetylglucosaminyltransferase 2-like [Patiria miniata]|uniref:Glycosyltransferase 61 catalytic domain-containing protein n=1 Tax=Patiria miniata TaxID=46514 RepID=A0A914B2N3_PATMI|nr:protein O-linked-mannose beta-1,4-N-acetylglucosaminyltransferase 2-like [Patiria miniata]